MKLDILAIAAHPDDAELSCSGTLLKHIAAGKKCGIIDLTQGELGTRGSAKLRAIETAKATKIMKLSIRENLKMEDGFFLHDKKNQLHIIQQIRLFQPEIVLCNAVQDRHPDHGRAAVLVSEACYYSGLMKIETKHNNKLQKAWRPKAVYHYIQDRNMKPDFVIDVSPFVGKKMQAINAYSSQFYDPNSKEPESPISQKDFLDFVKSKMKVWGRDAGFKYAEGFTVERSIGIKDLFSLI